MATRLLNPVTLHLLLHYYIGWNCETCIVNSESINEARQFLITNDLIKEQTGNQIKYTTTDKGSVYINGIMNMQLPIQKWSMESQL